MKIKPTINPKILKDYIIYKIMDKEVIVAIPRNLEYRIINLHSEYKGLENAPDSEVIECFILQYNDESNEYILNENNKDFYKFNELKG